MREGEVDGDGYWYIGRETMEIDIDDNRYLEYGEFDGNLYGTKFDSIRRVIKSGRMCVVDVNPQVLTPLITQQSKRCTYVIRKMVFISHASLNENSVDVITCLMFNSINFELRK